MHVSSTGGVGEPRGSHWPTTCSREGGVAEQGPIEMTFRQRIKTTEVGGVTVVTFVDHKILEAPSIQELGEELFALVEQDGYRSMLLDFSSVEFLSSAALNKLIILDKKIKDRGGELKLCNLQPEIREVFVITRLNQLFDIKTTKDEALQAF
jgi:anti-sigma B factor antagonist